MYSYTRSLSFDTLWEGASCAFTACTVWQKVTLGALPLKIASASSRYMNLRWYCYDALVR